MDAQDFDGVDNGTMDPRSSTSAAPARGPIVVEVKKSARKVIERHRFDSSVVKIGRAYDNDLIITERHINPHHCRLVSSDEGGFVLEDLDSLNGVRVGGKRISESTKIASGQEFHVGETRLRVLDANHPVAAALPFGALDRLGNVLQHPFTLALYIALFFATAYFNSWSDSTTAINLSSLAGSYINALAYTFAWAATWGIAGVLIKHESKLIAQFSLACLALPMYTALEWINTYLQFVGLTLYAAEVLNYALVCLAAFALLAMALFLATSHLTTALKWVAAGIVALLLAVNLSSRFSNTVEFSSMPEYPAVLLPERFRLGQSPSASDEFVEQLTEVFDEADRMRDELNEKDDSASN